MKRFTVVSKISRCLMDQSTPFDALSAATRHPGDVIAKMTGQDDSGTVALGKRADLVLLSDNPLENISNTRGRIGVMVRGQWFTQSELDTQVDGIVAAYQK